MRRMIKKTAGIIAVVAMIISVIFIGPLKASAADEVKVFVGLGSKGGGTVNITTTLVDFKANASTTKNFGREQTITVP